MLKYVHSSSRKQILELQSCAALSTTEDHTCLLTQVNVPYISLSQTGRYSIYLPRKNRRLSWLKWLDRPTYRI